jgi:hypothetical protein
MDLFFLLHSHASGGFFIFANFPLTITESTNKNKKDTTGNLKLTKKVFDFSGLRVILKLLTENYVTS